jgi:uncharacterized protein (TIGR02996 family)
MSADEDGLVRAVLANPHDGLARSAYADWLEEQGKPIHAELYRGAESVERESKLTAQLDDAIREAYPDSRAGTLSMSRGMLGGGILQMYIAPSAFISKKFQACGEALLREFHVVRVFLSGKTKDWTMVGDAPALAGLRSLVVREGEERHAALARCDGVGHLFSLSAWHFKGRLLVPLVTSEKFRQLIHLDLGRLKDAAKGLPALASGPLAGRLQRLDLADARLHGDGFAVLLRSAPLLGGLTTLSLYKNGLDDADLETLAASLHLGRLRALDLCYNELTGTGLMALARSRLAGRLRWVGISVAGELPEASHRALVEALSPDCRVRAFASAQSAEQRMLEKVYGGRLDGG